MAEYHAQLNKEIPLFNKLEQSGKALRERETIDSLSDIYSIIIALDQVEKAYLRGTISNEEYTNAANKLLAQYKTYLASDNEDLKREFGDLYQFKNKYSIIASNAITRLERGIPVTTEHPIHSESTESSAAMHKNGGKNIAEATGNFITTMDAIKLNYKAKDQLHPLLAELLLSINRVTPSDFENRAKLVEWIVKINKLKADEQLSEKECRELLFDLELAYKSFYTLLK